MSSAVISQVIDHMESLPLNLQGQVLAFVRALNASFRRGSSGSDLLHFAGSIEEKDLRLMSQAIADGCEQVDLNELQHFIDVKPIHETT